MVSGLADQKQAFNPLSRVFCDIVEENYFLICFSRTEEGSTLYTNIIKLYNDWTTEMKRNKVQEKIELAAQELDELGPAGKRTPIGM